MAGSKENKKRVLIVEDESALRRALEIKFLQAGWRVDTAANGQEALSAVARETPDAIVLDLLMPVMDGVDFLKTFRVEQGSRVPVVVLTVLTSGILFDQGKALQVDDYLVKDQASLDQIVQKVAAIAG